MQRKDNLLLSNTKSGSSRICFSHKNTFQCLSITRHGHLPIIYIFFSPLIATRPHQTPLPPNTTGTLVTLSELWWPPNPPQTPNCHSRWQLHLFVFCVCVYIYPCISKKNLCIYMYVYNFFLFWEKMTGWRWEKTENWFGVRFSEGEWVVGWREGRGCWWVLFGRSVFLKN